MKFVVVGGTGLIGSTVVNQLEALGHVAVAASPSTGVDTITGAGLAEAVAGADVVVDVTNSPSFEDGPVLQFFTESTKRQLEAEQVAGVAHHVALSIVGVEHPSEGGYFRAKAAQEALIRDSGVPYSIVHATQFFEFIEAIAATATSGDSVTLPPVQFQPVAAVDVATVVTEVAVDAPINGVIDIAGPDRGRFSDIVAQVLTARGDQRTVVADPDAPYFGAPVEETTLVPTAGHRVGAVSLQQWLDSTPR